MSGCGVERSSVKVASICRAQAWGGVRVRHYSLDVAQAGERDVVSPLVQPTNKFVQKGAVHFGLL